jgi:aspartate racemase
LDLNEEAYTVYTYPNRIGPDHLPRKHNEVRNVRTQHIGIVACTAEGAALCYRTICAEGANLLGENDHPEVSMHSHSLAEYKRCMSRGDWPGVGELMLSSANKLAKMGADFFICPATTIHLAWPHIESRLPIPGLHIATVSAQQALERGFHRIGLTGTRHMTESEIFPEKLGERGLEYVRPELEQRIEIDRIIFDELVHGVVNPKSVNYFQLVISRMQERGCDAVVLGCTEIPLIMNDDNSPLPVIDSTRLLARAALRRAVHAQDGPSAMLK